MTTSTTVSLIRHGHVHNPDDIYYGRLPNFRLSETGRTEAKTAGRVLRQHPITTIYASPMLRAQQTAQLIQAELTTQPPIQTADHLIEVHTPHDGISRTILANRNWDLYTGNQFPYEKPADVLNRVQQFLTNIGHQHEGEHVLAITHGDIVAFSVLWAASYKPTAQNRVHLPQIIDDIYPHTASITTLTLVDLPPSSPTFSYHNPHII